MRFLYRKKNRLYSEKEIKTLFAEGSIDFVYPIKAISFLYANKTSDYKILISVSKRNFTNAVDRNLIKRRIKEATRKNIHQLALLLEKKELGMNIALIYVSEKISSAKEIEDIINQQIINLSRRIEKIE